MRKESSEWETNQLKLPSQFDQNMFVGKNLLALIFQSYHNLFRTSIH